MRRKRGKRGIRRKTKKIRGIRTRRGIKTRMRKKGERKRKMRKRMRRRRMRRRSKSTSLLNPDLFLSASWFVNFFQVLSLCDKLSHAFSVILNGTQAARLPT